MATQELAPRPQSEIEKSAQQRLIDVLGRYKKSIDAVLPKMMSPQRFAWLAIQAIRTNPNIAACSPSSFLNSVILATQMGIEIRRDSAYLVPYGKDCQLLIDYKAKLDLARRSGKVKGIQAVTVREKDAFSWKYGAHGVEFSHDPFKDGIKDPDERGPIVAVYAFAHVESGIQFREPMSLREIDRIRRRSRAGVREMSLADILAANQLTEAGDPLWNNWEYKDKRRKPWVTDFEAMALKTVLHSLCKSLPLSPEAQLSQEVDDGLDTGKQPDALAEIVDVQFEDTQPMIESMDADDYEKYKAERIQQAEVTLKTQRAPRKPFAVKHGEKAAATAEKIADAVIADGMRYGSELNRAEAQLGTSEFMRIAGVLGHDGFSMGELDATGRANLATQMLREAGLETA